MHVCAVVVSWLGANSSVSCVLRRRRLRVLRSVSGRECVRSNNLHVLTKLHTPSSTLFNSFLIVSFRSSTRARTQVGVYISKSEFADRLSYQTQRALLNALVERLDPQHPVLFAEAVWCLEQQKLAGAAIQPLVGDGKGMLLWLRL